MDSGRGLATVDAPRAQGVTGFLGRAPPSALGDVTIASAMDYGTVLVVSMDDRPLRTSERLLVQVMSEDRNRGWATTPPSPARRARAPVAATQPRAGRPWSRWGDRPSSSKTSRGSSPSDARTAGALRVRPLDFNGYDDLAAPADSRALGGAGELRLLPHTLYYLVEKKAPRP